MVFCVVFTIMDDFVPIYITLLSSTQQALYIIKGRYNIA